jgi:hypothetical protein
VKEAQLKAVEIIKRYKGRAKQQERKRRERRKGGRKRNKNKKAELSD